MKKIAILIDLELNQKSGGHVKFWERISNALKNKKIEFSLEFFFLGKENKKVKVSKSVTLNILKPIFPSNTLKFLGIDADSTDLFPFNPRLFFYLKKFDLIHTTDQLFSMSKTAKFSSKFWKIPLTSSYHTDTPSYTEYYVSRILNLFPKIIKNFFLEKIKLQLKVAQNQKKKIKFYFNSCEKIIIDFKNLEMDLVEKNDLKKVCNLQRGVNKTIFKKKKIDKNSLLKKFKVKDTKNIIFFCGRIHELKGAIFLSRIHKELKNKGLSVATVLAGENIHGSVCSRIGGKDLYILSYLQAKNISSFLNICDLFVFPSLYEVGPQVVLEAKQCNAVCVVAPEGGGKRINNNFDGIIVKKYLLKEWVKEIEYLLVNKKKIKEIKNNLRLSNFQPSWSDVFFENFYNNWKKILEKK